MTTKPSPIAGLSVGVDALLSDGSVATVRPLTRDDLPGLDELHRQATERTGG